MRPGMRTRLPRADHHVVASGKLFQQQRNILRLMLAIGIHEDQHVALGGTGAGLDGRAIAQGIMVAQPRYPKLGADIGGVIRRTIVYDKYLGIQRKPDKPGNNWRRPAASFLAGITMEMRLDGVIDRSFPRQVCVQAYQGLPAIRQASSARPSKVAHRATQEAIDAPDPARRQ